MLLTTHPCATCSSTRGGGSPRATPVSTKRVIPLTRRPHGMAGHGHGVAWPVGRAPPVAAPGAASAEASSNEHRSDGGSKEHSRNGSSPKQGGRNSPRDQAPDAAAAAAAAAVEDPAAGGSDDAQQQLRAEVSELRQLLIAQAKLVQAQQRTIAQLEATVGQAVVQQSAASTAAASAAEAAATAVASAAQRMARAAPAFGGASAVASGNGGGSREPLEESKAEESASQQLPEVPLQQDRRLTGMFDARFHSTSWGATPRDFRILPRRIFLVRHAESEGNVDNIAYTYIPDARVPLTARGWQQAMAAGEKLKATMEHAHGSDPYKLFFYTSPYLRSRQTYEGLALAFSPEQVQGVQEEVQLREQDFGNWQDVEGKKQEKAERLRFGRFFYRFPNGESGADVYDRMTIFEDHLVRDINAGRFAGNTSLVLCTHGLALRIFLMRWFHWTVDDFMNVFNPPNAEPLMLELVDDEACQAGSEPWIHTKALYRLSDSSREIIKGCTEEMCQTSWFPRGINPLDPADRMLLPDNP